MNDDIEDLSDVLDEIVDQADREFRRRHRQGRTDDDVPEVWRSYYYLRQGYHVGGARRTKQGHWQGGEVRDRGAKCHLCKRPLTLLWEINCQDPRFQKESEQVFEGQERLPLYYCLHCPEPTIYRCTGPNRIRVLPTERSECEESPFERIPDSFARRPLVLKPIPREIENLIVLSEHIGLDWLRRPDFATLKKYFADISPYFMDVRRSQFGGLPVVQQGHDEIPCPNKRCPTHKWGHPIMRNKQYYYMKELALIDDDAGFEMESNGAQIAFHLCWACHTVHAGYHVD